MDSTALYTAGVVGNWSVTNAQYPNIPSKDLELYSGGSGKFIGEGGQPYSNGGYAIKWSITKSNNKYYLYEDGFWHPGYNNFREIDNDLPNVNLSYPVTFFKTYNKYVDGKGPVEALTYIKK